MAANGPGGLYAYYIYHVSRFYTRASTDITYQPIYHIRDVVQSFGKIRYLVFIQDRGEGRGSSGTFGKISAIAMRYGLRTPLYLVWIQDSEFSQNFGPHPLADNDM